MQGTTEVLTEKVRNITLTEKPGFTVISEDVRPVEVMETS
jgi:hypothetical protein